MAQDSLISLNGGNTGARNIGTENGGNSRYVRRALIAKNREGFITEILKIPDERENNFQKCKRADYMVMSWILNSMSPKLADEFGFIENSADLSSELQERFGQSNGPLVYQLKKEISALKQENLSIVAYYEKKLQDLEAEDKLMQFLLRLNSGFNTTISSLLSMDPMPTINCAFSIVQ
ncbi:uncharacterized protein LOC109135185 [Beta vulgaris subsp. vulgaris]|uniref:uncharacterized protein LOC109135185 n=1 Tax=Beta vulgaris subsp. vulgaris TaxID=3555 RepID=UPI002036E66B|nr:uncharacterized protein LOC109135185 [Beta vulgaris subsp. vulgaris]